MLVKIERLKPLTGLVYDRANMQAQQLFVSVLTLPVNFITSGYQLRSSALTIAIEAGVKNVSARIDEIMQRTKDNNLRFSRKWPANRNSTSRVGLT